MNAFMFRIFGIELDITAFCLTQSRILFALVEDAATQGTQTGEAGHDDRTDRTGFRNLGQFNQIFFTDINREDDIIEVPIGLLIDATVGIDAGSIEATVEIFEAEEQVALAIALIGVGNRMLECIEVGGLLGAKEIAILLTVVAIRPQPEVELSPGGQVTEAHTIAEVEGIATEGTTAAYIRRTTGDIAEEQIAAGGAARGLVGQLVAIASRFIDEERRRAVIALERQLRQINLEEGCILQFEAFLLNKLLEGRVVKASLARAENRTLSPIAIPGKAASGLSTCGLGLSNGNDCADTDDCTEELTVHRAASELVG
jgi:hypothetical protein